MNTSLGLPAEPSLHTLLCLALLGLGLFTFIALFFVAAPYGRHVRGGWGPTVPNRVGWIVMESPAVLLFLAIFAQGQHRAEPVPLVFLAVWLAHYVHRAFVFPFRLHTAGKQMPLSIVVMAVLFNTLNAYLNARWISHLGVYDASWLTGAPFLLGLFLFAAGWVLNLHSDTVLIHLRKPGETGYMIPHGGGFRWVSSPNYLGEIIEWLGWAVMTWSLAGVAFLVYTAANLAPRAGSNHRWMKAQFPDLPPERKALLPFLW